MKRQLAIALSLCLLSLSLGPSAPASFAQAVSSVRAVPAARVAPAIPASAAFALTAAPALPAAPALSAASVLPAAAAPALSAAPAPAAAAGEASPSPFARTMQALEAAAPDYGEMGAGESRSAAEGNFMARIGQDGPEPSEVELLVSAPEDSGHRLTRTVYPLALSKPGTNFRDVEFSLRSEFASFGLPMAVLAAHRATAVGAVSLINTAVLRAPAGEAAAFAGKLRSLGFAVREGRTFEVPKPLAAAPRARTVGLKEMSAVIGADKLQAALTKVLGEPLPPAQKASLVSTAAAWLGRAARRAVGFAVENPVLPWAVLDTWVSVDHPYLKGRFVKSVSNDDDGESHGTHTAGTVVGVDRWNLHGRNYNIFPGGRASEGDILFKVNMAREDGALATTNSWGEGSGNPEGAIEKLFVKTADEGLHHSISAGNNGSSRNTIGGPAISYRNVELSINGKVVGTVKRIKAVAASDAKKKTASFSSRGPGSRTTEDDPEKYKDYPVKPDESGVGVNLVAPVPRGSVVAELGGPGKSMSGTSMSNPGVFGGFLLLTRAVLVLLKDDLPVLPSAQQTQFAMDLARHAMTMTAEKVAPPHEVGDGFVNVWNAFEYAAKLLKDNAPQKALPALRAWARSFLF